MNATPTTIQDLTMLLADLQERADRLSDTLEATRKLIAAVQLTRQHLIGQSSVDAERLESRQDFQPLLVPETSQSWTEKLRGMKHMEAIRRIAQEKNGVIKVTDVRNIMISAGLITGKPRNASSHLFHLLDDSVLFEKIAPGTYRLTDTDTSRPDNLAVYGRSNVVSGSLSE